jgi:hypothetical protein
MELLLVCGVPPRKAKLALHAALMLHQNDADMNPSLGSQAVSRELKLYDSPPPMTMNVTHMLPSALSAFELGMPSSTTIGKMHALLAMPDPAGSGSEFQYATGSDVLGNVLVPYFDPGLDLFSGDRLDGKWKGWWDTSVRKFDREGFRARLFSSHIGIQLMIKAYPKYCRTPTGICSPYLTDKVSGKISFNTSYIQVNCSIPHIQNNSTFVSGSPYIKTILNITNDEVPSIQVSQRWNESIIVSSCNLTDTNVEMQVLCEAGGCTSQKARRWFARPLSSTLFRNKTAAATFFNELLHAGGTPSSELDLEPIDQKDIFKTWKTNYSGLPDTDPYLRFNKGDAYTMNAPNMFLTKMINAYLSASQQVLFNSSDESVILKLLDGEVRNPSHPLAILIGGPFYPSYRINYIWIAIDFLSCFVLLVAASVAVHLRRKILAPDIFGYVSSLTRDNPQINLPEGGSTLSGLERARMLKKVKVKIADVSGDDGVGRVGLARLGSTESMTGVKDLEKGKRYV